jgi:(p)ppGpp synthase/HD superfamily hydrolase
VRADSRGYSPALDRALALAARAHREQVRKGSSVPYILHPVHVAIILLKHGFPEEVAIAGVLHDVVEDCDVTPDEIRSSFGDAVAGLVLGVTETKEEEAPGTAPVARPWRVRKEEQLAHLARATPEGAALKAADSLHNCESTLADLGGKDLAERRATWSRFNAPPEDQIWYYRAVARTVRDRLGDHPLARELEAAVERLAALAL